MCFLYKVRHEYNRNFLILIHKNLITRLIVDEDDQNSRTKSQLLGKYFNDIFQV